MGLWALATSVTGLEMDKSGIFSYSESGMVGFFDRFRFLPGYQIPRGIPSRTGPGRFWFLPGSTGYITTGSLLSNNDKQ